jgi:hypothetical protein
MADLLIDYDSLDQARGQVTLGVTGYTSSFVFAGLGSAGEMSESSVGSAAVALVASARDVCGQADTALGDSATAVASALAAAIDALKATDAALAAGAGSGSGSGSTPVAAQ